MVLRTTPATRAAKRMMPRMAKATVRSLRRSQALWVIVRPTRIAPRVMKKAMAPRRRVMFMLVKSVYLVEQNLWPGGDLRDETRVYRWKRNRFKGAGDFEGDCAV